MADDSLPTYGRLLEEALELGRIAGRFAAAFEPPAAGIGDSCVGRAPEAVAQFLWGGRPGEPPSGLEVNAPLWYAAGFAEGLVSGAARQRESASPQRFRRVFG
jgi:hypothetical protein